MGKLVGSDEVGRIYYNEDMRDGECKFWVIFGGLFLMCLAMFLGGNVREVLAGTPYCSGSVKCGVDYLAGRCSVSGALCTNIGISCPGAGGMCNPPTTLQCNSSLGANPCTNVSEANCESVNINDCSQHCTNSSWPDSNPCTWNINCTWTGWVDVPNSCGDGDCTATQSRQSRTVDPAGCSNATQCVDNSSCNACTSTNPTAPILNSPANATQVRVNLAVSLVWNAVASWGTNCSGNNNRYEVCVMSGATCDLVNYVNNGTNLTYNWTPLAADPVVTWKIRASNGSNTATSTTRTVCAEGFNAANPAYVSAWTPACGSQTRTCTENCGTDDCASVDLTNCQHCAPTLGVWSACDANHERTRTCTENDGLCDGNDCASEILTEDCAGTITGTLFDASDLLACPGDIGTNPAYASIRFSNETFGITGTWPVISAPVATDANGNYSESVYAPGTYSYDYTDLYNSGAAVSVKFECQSPTAIVDEQGETVVKDTGFWRIFDGWWQVTGGSIYAKSGIRSYIPASVSPASNQKLILADANGRTGMLSYGVPWTGAELGMNPSVGVSDTLWRIESLYDGLRFDYNYYSTRMDVFDSTAWDGGNVIYTDIDNGYQIFKHTGDINPLDYGGTGPTGTQKVILLVDGNVNINSNVTVPDGAFLAIIASGDITFGSAVTDAQGWFVAETISVPSSGGVDVQFDGQGSFVGWTSINLARNMGVTNNTAPAEKFTYRRDMFINAPTPMKIYTKSFSPFIP